MSNLAKNPQNFGEIQLGWQKGPHEKCDFYENDEFNKDCFVGKLEHASENRGSFYL